MTARLSYFPADPSARPQLRYITVAQLFDETVAKHEDREALVFAAQEEFGLSLRWSYGEFQQQALDVAAGLVASGVGEGDGVAVFAPNVPEFVVLQIACAYVNAVLVPLNPLYRTAEVTHALNRTEASICFVVPEDRGTSLWDVAHAAAEAATRPWKAVAIGDAPDDRGISWAQWLDAVGDDHRLEVTRRRRRGRPDDLSQLQLTSGTTGAAKVVRLPNWICVNQGFVAAHIAQIDETVRWVNPNPLFHCGGSILACLGTIAAGGCHLPMIKFSPPHVVRAIESERATMYSGVPTMLALVEDEVARNGGDLSSLEKIMSGGSPVPEDLARRYMDRYGVSFVITYGQTEHGPLATCSGPADSFEDQYRTCGRPIPHADLDVVVPGTDERVPCGVEGEVRFRGFVMDGYDKDPEATAAAVSPDGWLRSGDLGTVDERGYLKVTGRAKDVIIRGGENIAPAAVEDAVRLHPWVLEAAAIGVPDETYGEQVCAYVQLRDGHDSLTREELVEALKGQVARYKLPQYVRVVDEMPKTPSGKLQKYVLKEMFAAEGAA